jgi:transcriptional regulator GlxA family with amidase domain
MQPHARQSGVTMTATDAWAGLMSLASCTFHGRVADGAVATMVDPPAAAPFSDGHARIVARAREWLAANLAEPITVDALVAAARTSRRTLHRAFVEVLGETPRDHVLRLRLERIRAKLEAAAGNTCTVADIATRWGIGEIGRFAARYRAQFGELPSATLARARGAGILTIV